MSNPTPPAAPRYSPRALGVAALTSTALVAALSLFWPQTERAALQSLPEPERRALFERTLRTANSSCDPAKRPSGLADFCYRQGVLLLEFPECDAGCVALSARLRNVPAR